MCLGIAMRIIAIDGFHARCEAGGIAREVNLFLLQDQALQSGDFVLVHVGYAIQKVSADEALSSRALFDELIAGTIDA